MTSARERILGRLRQSAPVQALPCPPAQAELLARLAPFGGRTAIQALADNLKAAHAEVLLCARGQAAETVATLARERGWKRLVFARGVDPLPRIDGAETRVFDREFEALKSDLFDAVDAGITRAECAIADTGTLVLRSGPDSPRTLSLVPPVNVCIVDAGRLHRSLADALVAEGWSAAMPTNLIFVSGPSKTADIQQTLAYGAHGPKELIVLIEGSGE